MCARLSRDRRSGRPRLYCHATIEFRMGDAHQIFGMPLVVAAHPLHDIERLPGPPERSRLGQQRARIALSAAHVPVHRGAGRIAPSRRRLRNPMRSTRNRKYLVRKDGKLMRVASRRAQRDNARLTDHLAQRFQIGERPLGIAESQRLSILLDPLRHSADRSSREAMLKPGEAAAVLHNIRSCDGCGGELGLRDGRPCVHPQGPPGELLVGAVWQACRCAEALCDRDRGR